MAATMIVLTTTIYWVLSKSSSSARQLTHSLQITRHLKAAQNVLTDAEERGHEFMLSGKKLPGETGDVLIAQSAALNPDSLLACMPEYSLKVQKLNSLIQAKMLFAKEAAGALNAGNKQQAMALAASGRGILLMDSIKAAIDGIQVAENAKIQAITNREVKRSEYIFTVLCTGVLICLVLLFIFYRMIARNTLLREKTEADLLEAKNMAEAASRAKSTFLATMSQEVRAPMHDIISTATLLAETPLTPEQRRHTGKIQRSSMTLLSVVNDIIDYSNIESLKIPLETSPFILRDCLEQVLDAAGENSKGSHLNYHIDASVPTLVDCDAARLRQVLMTVTSTSLKNNSTGRIDCNVRLAGEENNVMDIEFNIINTYLTPGEIDNLVLKPGDDQVNVKESLFGMSSIRFSIAARLVSLMGGNIKVATDTGKSITTTIVIKAKRVDAIAAEKQLNNRKPIQWLAENEAEKIPLNILVVDDNEVNQALLVQMLTRLGHKTSTARNGVEASGMAVEEKYDVIFMDIAMPIMDGIDATKRIREYYVNTDTPLIIGVTANALYSEKQKGFDAGMNDFLLKPYKPADVKNLLEKWTALVFKLKYEL